MTSAMATKGLRIGRVWNRLGKIIKKKKEMESKNGNVNGAVDVYKNIDEWMRDSIVEIVTLLCFARSFPYFS
ncbi:hypothetical protein O6P43_001541 [Quillaja saponaria]|uniref:Uncharacterized protein n=1 Tax=Quillaja saponaria TaxID=32244 RepID=A0AAD7VNP2_QUISA|nr:hypothetical protein O6P43_001479 [Quillaja saponaria]KAJ7982413.1 hypothetical protein O6P43_001541 [Quillaja saponaria]